MQLLKFKALLLGVMGYYNILVTLLSVCLTFSSLGDNLKTFIFLAITVISSLLGVICLKGYEKEKLNIRRAEEEKKAAMRESFKRMRDILKEEK